MFKRILAALDGSEFAEQALRHAEALAREGAELVLLRVAGHPLTHYYIENTGMLAIATDDTSGHCANYLEEITDDLARRGVKAEFVVGEGLVADQILHEAAKQKADLIVLSTHGRTGVGRWLLGSVADRVVQHSSVPVLLVRPTLPGDERPTLDEPFDEKRDAF